MTAAELQNGDIMGNFKEYEHCDALGLAELVHQKQVSPTELCEAAIEKIDHFNPVLNAVVTRMYEDGCKRASDCLPGGPFAGVPFLLKGLNATCLERENGCQNQYCELQGNANSASHSFVR